MKKEYKIPEQLVIKKSLFTIKDIVWIIFGTWLFIVVFDTIMKLILLTFIAGIALSRFDRKKQIIIDKEGITLRCNDVRCIQRNKLNDSIQWKNRCIPWNDIKYTYINHTRAYHRNKYLKYYKSGRIKYFHIETTCSRLTVNITAFSYNSSLVNRCINHFSGKNLVIQPTNTFKKPNSEKKLRHV